MFTGALSTTAKARRETRCPSSEEWIEKVWSIYTMEYDSAIRKSEILPFTVTWMELERIMLSEISQTEKDNYHVISLNVEFKKQNR